MTSFRTASSNGSKRGFGELQGMPSWIAPENYAEAPDLNPRVHRFVGQLRPAYRDALILTEWQGLTQEEMAGKFGLSVSGAKSRVQRARSQLKELLLDCCRFEIDRRGNVLEMHPRRKS